MVKIFPPAMATLENPEPSPCAVQSSVGPSAGRAGSSPFSSLMPSRLGPRHCGQSAARAAAADVRTARLNGRTIRKPAGEIV